MTTKRELLTALAGVGFATAAHAQPSAPQQPLYVFLYRAGPAFRPGKPLNEQRLGPHAAYIKKLLDEGRLVAGGPMPGFDGGMAIVRAATRAEAEAMLAADPAITSGVFVADLRAWDPRFDSRKPLRP